MTGLAAELARAVAAAEPRLLAYAASGPGPCARETIGGLVDRACHLHPLLVRALATPQDAPLAAPRFDEARWLEAQRYGEADWDALVRLWAGYGRHLARLVGRLPSGAGDRPCGRGLDLPVSLRVVVEDEVGRMYAAFTRLPP